MSDLPTLILMCGFPRSGKSTLAREISRQLCAPIVCPDEVRLALHGREFEPRAEGFVWAITKTMVRALFGSGHNWVILDGCNNERKHRDEWDRPKEWDRRVVCMPTDEFTCIDRAHGDGCEHLVGVIERMARRQEPPEEIDLLRIDRFMMVSEESREVLEQRTLRAERKYDDIRSVIVHSILPYFRGDLAEQNMGHAELRELEAVLNKAWDL